MIKNIVFDVGSVLVEFRPQDTMRDLGADEETVAALSETTFQSRWWRELDRGVLDEAQAIAHMRAETPEKYHAVFDTFFTRGRKLLVRSFDYAAGWLRDLRERGYGIYLLSNYPRNFFELHSNGQFTFLPYIDGKIVSGYVGEIKPDAAIYRRLLATYRLIAEECVFIDDVPENIAAAEALGMRGIVFTSYADAVSQLETALAKK